MQVPNRAPTYVHVPLCTSTLPAFAFTKRYKNCASTSTAACTTQIWKLASRSEDHDNEENAHAHRAACLDRLDRARRAITGEQHALSKQRTGGHRRGSGDTHAHRVVVGQRATLGRPEPVGACGQLASASRAGWPRKPERLVQPRDGLQWRAHDVRPFERRLRSAAGQDVSRVARHR
eukprot:6383311-Prymnesium_polylepis.1